MTWIFIGAIIVLLLVGQAAMLAIVLRGRKVGEGAGSAGMSDINPEASAMNSGMMLLQKQIENLASSLDARMSESSRNVNETVRNQLGESSRLIREITQELTSVKEIGRQTQTYAEQLQSLQDLLKNPKQRGILGEYYLETVLKNVMSPHSARRRWRRHTRWGW